MKKCLPFAVCLMVMPVCGIAQTNILSTNAVGYFRYEVPKGQFDLVCVQFLNLPHGSRTAEEMFYDQFPIGTTVFAWDEDRYRYVMDDYSFLGWSSNIEFDWGSSFWLHVPAAAPSNEYVAYVLGEVPSAPSIDVCLQPGFNMTCYPYPAESIWSETAMSQSASTGDFMVLWNGTNYEFNALTFLGWTEPDMIIPVGKAFWYFNVGPQRCFTEVKPYVWP